MIFVFTLFSVSIYFLISVSVLIFSVLFSVFFSSDFVSTSSTASTKSIFISPFNIELFSLSSLLLFSSGSVFTSSSLLNNKSISDKLFSMLFNSSSSAFFIAASSTFLIISLLLFFVLLGCFFSFLDTFFGGFISITSSKFSAKSNFIFSSFFGVTFTLTSSFIESIST